jgi:hypothetical protein
MDSTSVKNKGEASETLAKIKNQQIQWILQVGYDIANSSVCIDTVAPIFDQYSFTE